MTGKRADARVTKLDDLLSFLDASPSPWHAVASAARRLDEAGFQRLDRTTTWSTLPPAAYVVREGALIAFRSGASARAGSPFVIAGAHTDSPGLRIKPRPDATTVGWRQLGVEVYGGALLNSWLDRDLGIAGRVVLTDGSTADLHADEPIARVPQLAIHLDREVNERGLTLDKQLHLTPVWGTSLTGAAAGSERDFRSWVAHRLEVDETDVAWWDLCLFDCTPAAVLGVDGSLLSSGRLDNQVSCWAAIDALAHVEADGLGASVAVAALFDHEEVGSSSTTGASGPLLAEVLERITLAVGGGRAEHLAALAGSRCVSADNAHAVHPNYPERHDPAHRPHVNQGPAIKINANQRYATSAETATELQDACRRAGVPLQTFVSRNNVPCGSTIGPLTATRLGVATVDVGVPQLSMHSARELCGARDPLWLSDALQAYARRAG